MKPRWLSLLIAGLSAASAGAGDPLDRLAEVLSFADANGTVRARLSGEANLEGYYQPEPVSDLLFTTRKTFLNPRLTLFLDAQLGEPWYVFAQARLDRRFDPTDRGRFRPRLDEYAVRYTPWRDGRLTVQAGQFATVVGAWAPRHSAWENAFITAPLPYDNLTGIWDRSPPASVETLLAWSHVRPLSTGRQAARDKNQRLPLLWGPSYATGVAVASRYGRFEYAVEVKNAGLSSRPKIWNDHGDQWDHPTISGRVGWRPDPAWNVGFSASGGTYLQPLARGSLRPGRGLGDYQQVLLAHDVAYAWRHWQLWAEVHAARFAIPGVGDADTLAYFLEAKYKLTPRLFAALRWNQQTFNELTDAAGRSQRWGRNAWRLDFAPGFRFTPHVQLKLQASLRHESPAVQRLTQAWATQLTVRF